MCNQRTIDIAYQFCLLALPSTNLAVKTLSAILLVLVILRSSAIAQNSNTVSQIVTVEVKPITKISISGNPGALIVMDAILGMDLTSVADENTTYSVTTNLENMKIVASINDRMPIGTRLMMSLSSSKAVSAGAVDVSNALAPVNVVTGLNKGSDKDQTIKYIFAADASVGEIEAESRTITLTLTD